MVFGGHKEVSSNWPGFGPISAIIQVVPPMPLAYCSEPCLLCPVLKMYRTTPFLEIKISIKNVVPGASALRTGHKRQGLGQ